MFIVEANKVNPADRYAPADFFVRPQEDGSYREIHRRGHEALNYFVDYEEQVIDLLQRVCTVSVEIFDIIRRMT